MPISKIVSVRKVREWTTGEGKVVYGQEVSLGDGIVGEANSMAPVPPYGVGDEVEYEIVREFRGVPQLKIKKAQAGGYQGGSGGFRKGGSSYNPKGQRVGMSVNCAVLLCCHGKIDSKEIPKIARWLYDLAVNIETECVDSEPSPAAKPAQANPTQPVARPAAPPPPPPPPARTGDSSNMPVDEEDIPF